VPRSRATPQQMAQNFKHVATCKSRLFRVNKKCSDLRLSLDPV